MYWGTTEDYNGIPSKMAPQTPVLLSLKCRQTSDGEGKVSYVYDPTGATIVKAQEIIACVGQPVDVNDNTSDIDWEILFKLSTMKHIRSHILHLDLLIRIHLKVLSCIQRTLLVFLVACQESEQMKYISLRSMTSAQPSMN